MKKKTKQFSEYHTFVLKTLTHVPSIPLISGIPCDPLKESMHNDRPSMYCSRYGQFAKFTSAEISLVSLSSDELLAVHISNTGLVGGRMSSPVVFSRGRYETNWRSIWSVSTWAANIDRLLTLNNDPSKIIIWKWHLYLSPSHIRDRKFMLEWVLK